MFYKGNVFQMWKKKYSIFASTKISGKGWKLILVFVKNSLFQETCSPQFHEIPSSENKYGICAEVCKRSF